MIKVNREPIKKDFLGIQNENWKAASRDLGAHALRLYLYLAANANGFLLALSPADIRQSIGMARSTYHDQFNLLIDKGYLIQRSGNSYEFFETPHEVIKQECSADAGLDRTDCDYGDRENEYTVLQDNIEIDNRDIGINNYK